MREDIIPKGPYCYTLGEKLIGQEYYPEPYNYNYCPYYQRLNIDGVSVPYCMFLKEGGLGNNVSDDAFRRLKYSFDATDEEIFDMFPLDLLWDGCKECGINDDWEND